MTDWRFLGTLEKEIMEVELIKERTPIARKVHRCMNCTSLAIQIGHAYVRSTLTYDGRIYDWVSCCACHDLLGEVSEYAGDFGISSDEFCEWAMDHRKTDPLAHAFLKRYYGDNYVYELELED